jgi:O-antigen/teichoic acid export membrane protein
MIKSGLVLTFFHAVVAVLGLVRNLMIARWLSVEDFGIASTFALTMALVEMSANIGLDRLIVQSKEGDSPAFQATLQGLQVVRGLLGSVFLFLLAYPLSEIFKSPGALWAYQTMAVIPLIRSLVHLDLNRFQRARIFWPSITTETTAQIVSTAVALLWAYEGGDYRSMLFALIAQQVTWSVLSHILAERRFQVGWNPSVIKQAVSFGWPLLLNGALMFGTFYGDRVIVGNQLGPAVLGWFSVAYMLTLLPSTLLMRVVQTLGLPVLSQSEANPARFKTLALVATEAGCLVAVLLVLGNALCGGLLIHMLFGAKYDLATTILVPLATVQALRLARSGPSVVAIAQRQTTNPMWANLLRVAFLPLAYIAALKGEGVATVVWIAVAGEFAGLVLSFVLIARKSGLNPWHLTRILISISLCLAAFLLYDALYPGEATALLHVAGPILLVVTAVYAASLTHLATWVRNRLHTPATGV